MEARNRCRVCGKTISKGFLCEECEEEILKKTKTEKRVFSLLTTLVLIFVFYFFYEYYKISSSQVSVVMEKSGIILEVLKKPSVITFLFLIFFVTIFSYFIAKKK